MSLRRVFLALFVPCALFGSDIDTVQNRLGFQANIGLSSADVKTATYLAILSDSGRFSDVSYGTSGGAGIGHPQRLQSIAQSFCSDTGRFHADTMVARKLLAGLKYWTALNLQDANWWYRYIGYPNAFWQCVVLSDSLCAARDTVQRRANWNYLLWAIRKGSAGYKTGANLVNISQSAIPAAAMMRDGMLLDSLVKTVTGETEYAITDGIHIDGSYSQHTGTGLQAYAGTYGQEFAKSVSAVAWIVRATAYAFDAASMERYEHFLLDGVRWLTMGKWLDIGAIGRGTARTGSSTYGAGFATIARQFAECNPSRAAELDAWADCLDANTPSGLVGNRFFWRHDMMVQQGGSWYASARATSTRTVGNESGNGEGLRNEHMGDGMLLLTQGNEYKDIYPVWDWHRLPGVTEIMHGDTFGLHDWGAGGLGGSAFAGGAGDGVAGVCAMRRNKYGITESKFWLFTPRGVVALGADIAAVTSYQVVTTIDQSLTNGTVLCNGNAIADSFATRGPAVIASGNRAVFILDTLNVAGSVADRTGSWKMINTGGSATSVTKKVFTAGIQHGANPQGAHYAYALTCADSGGFADPDDIVIEQNDASVMAATVLSEKTTGIVFRSASTLTTATGSTLSLDGKGCILLRETAEGLHIAVSDPEHLAATRTLTVSSATLGLDTVVTVTLPGGDSSGAARVIFLPTAGTPVWHLGANTTGFTAPRVTRNGLFYNNAPAVEYLLCDLSGRVLDRWLFPTSQTGVLLPWHRLPARGVYLLTTNTTSGRSGIQRIIID